MAKDFDFAGTWIHATLRPEDLIPSFVQLMHELPAETTKKYEGNIAEIEKRMEEDGYYDGEESQYDIEELFDMLNDVGPEGYYFGANEGDGSDFGYWPVEDETEYPDVRSGGDRFTPGIMNDRGKYPEKSSSQKNADQTFGLYQFPDPSDESGEMKLVTKGTTDELNQWADGKNLEFIKDKSLFGGYWRNKATGDSYQADVLTKQADTGSQSMPNVTKKFPTMQVLKAFIGKIKGYEQGDPNYPSFYQEDGEPYYIEGTELIEVHLEKLEHEGLIESFKVDTDSCEITVDPAAYQDYMTGSGYRSGFDPDYTVEEAADELEYEKEMLSYLGSASNNYGIKVDPYNYVHEDTSQVEEENVEASLKTAAFTRKHYVMIADVVKLIQSAGDRKKVANILADMFEKDNPAFDRDRFLVACGL